MLKRGPLEHALLLKRRKSQNKKLNARRLSMVGTPLQVAILCESVKMSTVIEVTFRLCEGNFVDKWGEQEGKARWLIFKDMMKTPLPLETYPDDADVILAVLESYLDAHEEMKAEEAEEKECEEKEAAEKVAKKGPAKRCFNCVRCAERVPEREWADSDVERKLCASCQFLV
jgi:hypothetical protein